MDNNTDQIAQYAKLSTIYKTIIYLQEEAVKEQEILNKLKQKEKNESSNK
jgi:hypothetical protein